MTAKVTRQRKYDGFPSFASWLQASPDTSALEKVLESAPDPNSISQGDLANALKIVRRAAAIDTGAIEDLYDVTNRGFTVSFAMESFLWQAKIEEKDRNLIQAQVDAYERIIDIINGTWPITEAIVRELHSEICKNQDTYIVETEQGQQRQPLPKGKYKDFPNNVRTFDGTLFEYCPPLSVASEMHKLIEAITSDAFQSAHPILQASWAHYAFVLVHPFADGNGRVARLLASLFLCKAASIPLLVFADEQKEYFRALRAADDRNFQQFINFTSHCAKNALLLLHESLQAAKLPRPEESLKLLHEAYYVKEGFTHEQLDENARKLLQKIKDGLSARLEAAKKTQPLLETIAWNQLDHAIAEPSQGMRCPKQFAAFQYTVATAKPLAAQIAAWVQVEISRDIGTDGQIQVRWRRGHAMEQVLVAAVEEIEKLDSSQVLQMKIDVVLERIVRSILDELARAAQGRRQKA